MKLVYSKIRKCLILRQTKSGFWLNLYIALALSAFAPAAAAAPSCAAVLTAPTHWMKRIKTIFHRDVSPKPNDEPSRPETVSSPSIEKSKMAPTVPMVQDATSALSGLSAQQKKEAYQTGVIPGEVDPVFADLPLDSPLRLQTLDWRQGGHRGSVYHLIIKSFRNWASATSAPVGIFVPGQWTQVADIHPAAFLRPDSTLPPASHPLFQIANSEHIDLVQEPWRAERKIFWAVEDIQLPRRPENIISTGHRQRIAVNYLDGKPHSVETWIYDEQANDWKPAYFRFENGLPVPEGNFLGLKVEQKCIQCHFNSGRPQEFPQGSPLPFAMWGGKYGNPSENGWRTDKKGVELGLNPGYSPAQAKRTHLQLVERTLAQ